MAVAVLVAAGCVLRLGPRWATILVARAFGAAKLNRHCWATFAMRLNLVLSAGLHLAEGRRKAHFAVVGRAMLRRGPKLK